MKVEKVCPVCTRAFVTFSPHLRVTCSRDCVRVHLAVKMKGRVPVEAVAAHKRSCRRVVQQAVLDEFGALTPREIEVFNFGVKVGYRRGYHYGKHREEAA